MKNSRKEMCNQMRRPEKTLSGKLYLNNVFYFCRLGLHQYISIVIKSTHALMKISTDKFKIFRDTFKTKKHKLTEALFCPDRELFPVKSAN